MDSDEQSFITSTFPSVWALELLLQLKAEPDRAFSNAELVKLLRASDAVVVRSGEALLAAGLIIHEEDQRLRYAPVSPELDALVERTRDLYRSRPDAVRRMIVSATTGGISAFADAFRLRRDPK